MNGEVVTLFLQRVFEEHAASTAFTKWYESRLTYMFEKALKKNPQVAERVESISASNLTLGRRCARLDNLKAIGIENAGTRFLFELEYDGGGNFDINVVLSIKIPLTKKKAKLPMRFNVVLQEMRGKVKLCFFVSLIVVMFCVKIEK